MNIAKFYCLFDNITKLGKYITDDPRGKVFGACQVPPHSPGLIELRIGNDDKHWSEPIPFIYYGN
jgi:hypothetical protein